MKNSDLISNIQKELISKIDEKSKNNYQYFFKEKVTFYGVKTDIVLKICNNYFKQIRHKSKDEIFEICEDLLKTKYTENAYITYNFTYKIRESFIKEDFQVFERWVNTYVSNWAECDTFCNHSIGFFIEKYPEFINNLKIWTNSKNRWVKRASAVSLIIPAKKGLFLKDIFEIVDKLILDKDDLVQKGYGWLLKQASINHTKKVFEYVIKTKKIMPRTALRYAIEKMPKDLKNLAMQK